MAAWFTNERAPAWRRVVAYLIDCLVIDAYLLGITIVSWTARAAGVNLSQVTTSQWLSQLMVIAVLTLPATLYLALTEASRRQATLGKRLLGLRVVSAAGGRPTFGQTLWRAIMKLFIPWELAHVVVHRAGFRVESEMHEQGLSLGEAMERFELVPLEVGLLVAVGVILAAYAITLFTPSGRTLYDRAAGTRIELT